MLEPLNNIFTVGIDKEEGSRMETASVPPLLSVALLLLLVLSPVAHVVTAAKTSVMVVEESIFVSVVSALGMGES